MKPVLLEFGPISIYAYGVMLAIGFLVAIYCVQRQSVKEGVDPNYLLKLCFYIFLSSIAGSRIFHIIFEDPMTYLKNPIRVFYFWKGGFVYYGGFIFAVLFSIYYTRKYKISFFKIADLMAPFVMLGLAFGRVGCFLAGCCYGAVCDLPWAVKFPAETIGHAGEHIHPTQIYESLSALLIYFILLNIRSYKRFHGYIFIWLLILYGIARGLLEFIREDLRGSLGIMSPSQGISLAMFVLAAVLYIVLGQRAKKTV